MARKGSVAPKERINIVYKPKTNGEEDVELPFKMLVMADLTGRPKQGPVEQRKPVKIDKDTFAAIMENMDLGLEVRVPSRLTDDDNAVLDAKLRFASLSDFTPQGVATQVPELQRLLELREALSSLKSPLGNRPEFRKRIQAILSDETARQRLLEELQLDEASEDDEETVTGPQ